MRRSRLPSTWVVSALAGMVLALLAGCSKTPSPVDREETPPTQSANHLTPSDRPVESASAAEAIQQGRAVFEGKGSCTLCHTIAGEGDEGRAPDLAGIGGRASQRAAQFGLQGADADTRYLIRSIIRPQAEVVADYNPAPESWLPSGLSDEEICNLVIYLQSLVVNPTRRCPSSGWPRNGRSTNANSKSSPSAIRRKG